MRKVLQNGYLQFLLVVMTIGLLFLLFREVIAPKVMALSNKFIYSVDLISLDDFYNENKQEFNGQERSLSTLYYEVVESSNQSKKIKKIFDVRTVNGKKIINIEKSVTVDPITWKVINQVKKKNDSSYLFAPLKIEVGKSFNYSQINYDKNILMKYDGKEIIRGLETYRYNAEFNVDQTKELAGTLPNVPDLRGVNLDVTLRLWIEPSSGWLVKSSDIATAYFYDIKTGERIVPWNSFSNEYSRTSLIEQVNIAKGLKFKRQLVETLLPFMISIWVLMGVVWKRKKGLAYMILGMGVLILGIIVVSKNNPWYIEEPIKIGISRWVPFGNQSYDNNVQGFKDALTEAGFVEGRDVVYDLKTASASATAQKEIADYFLDNKVDLIFSLTTPGTKILKENISSIPIVFSIVTYPVESGVVKSLKKSGNNLVGTRNWVSMEKQLEIYLEVVPQTKKIGFIHRKGEINSTIGMAKMIKAAEVFDISIIEISGSNLSELKTDIEQKGMSVDTFYSACDTLVQGEAEDFIINYAKSNNIKSFSCNDSGPKKGDLLGTVADLYQIGHLAGQKAALILNGLPPKVISTDTEDRPFIYINLKTAKELGVTVPQTIITKAKEVYQ